MSLLMKALEKAAKDRSETAQTPPSAVDPAQPAPATAPPVELSLEPLQAAVRPEPPPTPPLRAAAPAGRASRDQARAATVLEATAHATPAPASGPRIRSVMAVSIIGGVCALAYAIYFYLQISNPSLFIKQAPMPSAPLGQAPAQQPAPIAIGSVIAPADLGIETTARAGAPAPAEPARAAQRAPATAPAAARNAAPARNTIRVSAGSAALRLDSRLSQGYAALQAGQLDAARQFYADAARSEPNGVQPLLGLAAIAMQRNQTEDASQLYFTVLNLEPRNAYAQAGLIALLGQADPVSAEAKLKQLIAREPMASLYFTLGNLYGDQSRWAEAQQAYFQAHHLEPANPEYAYNLAVGLEHVGQSKLAAGFYQRAVAQATALGHASFDLGQAQERLHQLASQSR